MKGYAEKPVEEVAVGDTIVVSKQPFAVRAKRFVNGATKCWEVDFEGNGATSTYINVPEGTTFLVRSGSVPKRIR